jgi:hypothetical protein
MVWDIHPSQDITKNFDNRVSRSTLDKRSVKVDAPGFSNRVSHHKATRVTIKPTKHVLGNCADNVRYQAAGTNRSKSGVVG